jgi:hypothetical protein
MSARRLLLVALAYLVFDLADPALPGAFSFEVRDSKVEEAVHVRRGPEDRQVNAAQPAPPGRRVEPRDDSFIHQRSALTAPAPRDVAPRRLAPHEARQASAQSLDDH